MNSKNETIIKAKNQLSMINMEKNVKNEKKDLTFIKWTRGYFILFIVFMILYEMQDTYTSNYLRMVVDSIYLDLDIGDIQWYLIFGIASLGLFVVPVIQYLSDIVGRKPVMIFIFFGMGIASLILFFSQDIIQFTIGFFLLYVFFSSDMWIIIVSEEVPKEKRAKYIFLISFLGTIGAIAIPVSQQIFVDPNVPASWRGMTYFAISALFMSLLGFGLKETRAFRNRKDKGMNSKKKVDYNKIIEPFNQENKAKMIALITINFFIGAATAAASNIQKYLTDILSVTESNPIIISDTVAMIVTIAAMGSFFFFGVTGLLVDRIGRKPVFYIYIVLNVISTVCLTVMCPILAENGLFLVIALLSFIISGVSWGIYMLSKAVCVECFPTEIRGTSSGWRSLFYALGTTIGAFIAASLSYLNVELGVIYIIFAVVIGIILPPVIIKFLPETKGLEIVDIE
ncbi:MAG: MFS transporter [archaeon]|nr:MFS transporter [archaeon]